MNFQERLSQFIDQAVHNDRIAGNLTAIGALLATIACGWFAFRWLLVRTAARAAIAAQDGPPTPLATICGRLRGALGWLAFAAAAGTMMIGSAYHLAGRNLKRDLTQRIKHLTAEQLEALLWTGGKLIGLFLAGWLAAKLVRRVRALLEFRVIGWLRREDADETTRSWFLLLERYALAMVLCGVAACAGMALGFGTVMLPIVGFSARVTTILVTARLLTLAARALTQPAADWGDRRLRATRLTHYWQRLTRLIPLGERCFEAAVYVSAASLCVRELRFVAFVADYGPKIVQCIGIFFGTRVVIELLHVLLAELFGLAGENRPADQKRQTLVPLVQSGCQYLLYFGAVVMMMDVWGQDTKWLLASAGILGLAVGLGAQNLVTDIVSGFFILFEGQFLVGDSVEICGAKGIVEVIAVRHTQVRDEQGHLHIIPNGQIKQVVNHSKGYLNVVMDVQTSLSADVESVLRAMTEAGRTLHNSYDAVLAVPVVHGVVGKNLSEITIRAVTRVRPGFQATIEQEYRRLVEQALAEPQGATSVVRAA